MADFEEFDGVESDDVIGDHNKKKKKINSKQKGNRIERELTKLLTKRFDGKSFSRSVGSGNRWGQVANLPSHAKTTLTGDICPPEGFKWVIECKGGYEDQIDMNGVVDGGISCLDKFIEQSLNDNKQSNRKPLIVWKRARKPWLAMVRRADLEPKLAEFIFSFEYYISYRDWAIVSLEKLLESDDTYWFEKNNG